MTTKKTRTILQFVPKISQDLASSLGRPAEAHIIEITEEEIEVTADPTGQFSGQKFKHWKQIGFARIKRQ